MDSVLADMRGSPRRAAFEYGVLITLGSTLAAAYGFLIVYANQRNADGQRRGLPKVHLDEEVDLGVAVEDLKQVVTGMLSGQTPEFPSKPSRPDAGVDVRPGGEKK